MSIVAVSRLYKNAALSVNRHVIEWPEHEDVALAVGGLKASLGEGASDEFWRPLFSWLSRYRFGLGASPLPPMHPLLLPNGLMDDIEVLCSRAYCVFPSSADQAERLFSLLQTLTVMDINPLLPAVLNIVLPGAILLLREARFLSPTADVLRQSSAARIRVVTAETLKGLEVYPQIVALGPSRWFPHYVFDSPRSKRIDLINLSWVMDNPEPSPRFIQLSKSADPLVQPYVPGKSLLEVAESLVPVIDWNQISRKGESVSEDYQDDTVEARLLALSDDMAVFLEASDNSTVLCLNPSPETPKNRRVRRVKVPNIAVHDYLLLRTTGGGDYIQSLADQLLGTKAIEARSSLHMWKRKLRAVYRATGGAKLCEELTRHGANKASGYNIRNWISESTIKPSSLDDFRAIMCVTGIEEKCNDYWKLAKLIHRAHAKAGFAIRKKLLCVVANTDFSGLEATGRMDFVLEGATGGTLTAFMVEAISDQLYTLAIGRLGTLFKR